MSSLSLSECGHELNRDNYRMEIEIRAKAIEKLIDYTASGVGSIAGPMIAPWQAERERKAKLIRAETDAEILMIQARAQSEARKLAIEPGLIESGSVTISDHIEQSLKFQATKRITNVRSVVEQTAEAIEGEEVPNEEPNHDWTARFFDSVQDVSTQQLQAVWSKILAEEIRSPGSISILTLNIVKNIDLQTAKLFELLCSMCIFMFPQTEHEIDARIPTLGQHAGQNSLQKYGLNYKNLQTLTEHALINSDLDSWINIQICIGQKIDAHSVVKLPFLFNDKYWVLQPKENDRVGQEFRLHGVSLTKAGRELSKVVNVLDANDFQVNLENFFLSNKIIMQQVDKLDPIILNNVES